MFGNYLVYLTASVLLTVWLGSTLHREGRLFLIDCFHGAVSTADAVNHLLLTGFYLVNIAWISLTLKSSQAPTSLPEAVEFLAYRLGIVSLLPGGIHLGNILPLGLIRQRFLRQIRQTPQECTQALSDF